MAAQPSSVSPRERLIDAAVEHGAEHGLADTSLRQLAVALGTSHRMLIHHFGSKEGLLVEVVRRVEARQRDTLGQLEVTTLADADDPAAAMETLGRRFWESLNDPAVQRHERLFFEVYGQALQHRTWATPLLDDIVDSWVRPMAAMFEARGAPADRARIDARLAVAVARGLLLDVLATGEREEVDAAMQRFTELLSR
ncbi:MAG: hypothetical protein JWM34_5036 [Ilumatobacteraceae bacterium]|nr:hypothetical protein [Ilumatobacteraceae bacterium]